MTVCTLLVVQSVTSLIIYYGHRGTNVTVLWDAVMT